MRRDLVQRAMAHDHEAFSELARLSIDKLYAIAQLILHDQQHAEEATQEALVAAWRDIAALRDPDHRGAIRMTNPDLDRDLTAWLEERAPMRAPEHLLGATVYRTARTRPRPAWLLSERWILMTVALRPTTYSRGLLLALVTLGLLLVVAAATLLVGGRPTSFAAVAPPVGPAANGLIALQYLGDIYTVKPDGTDRRPIVEEPGEQSSPSWSPDGTRLAYWSIDIRGNKLMVVQADGSKPTVVAADVLDLTDWTPADWSPDGRSLAYSAMTTGQLDEACIASADVEGNFCSSRVFVAAVDGSTGAVQVGDPDTDARGPVWSPDGSTIAFGAGDTEAGIGLYLMDSDGGHPRRLGEVSGNGWGLLSLGWSPDGSTIVGTAGESSWNIWVTSVNDGSSRIVSDPPAEPAWAQELWPAYAPDGAIAWSRGGQAPACGCLVVLEDGGVPVELAEIVGFPLWSPDGKLIALTGNKSSRDAMLIVDRAGTIITEIDDVTFESATSWQRLVQ